MSYKIKELQEELKPRYRAKTKGLESLSDEELLSLIIRCGTKSKNVKELSLEVLQQIGSLDNFLNIDMKDLESIKGIGEVSALSILASIELGKRILKFHKDKVKLINSKKSPILDKEIELVRNIIKTREELKNDNRNFEFAEMELVDYYIYQIKANQAKLDYLLKLAKASGITIDRINQIKYENYDEEIS